MVAVPVPIPPPPITRPGGWDPSQTDPLGGPTVGQVWNKLKDALGVKPDTKSRTTRGSPRGRLLADQQPESVQ